MFWVQLWPRGHRPAEEVAGAKPAEVRKFCPNMAQNRAFVCCIRANSYVEQGDVFESLAEAVVQLLCFFYDCYSCQSQFLWQSSVVVHNGQFSLAVYQIMCE